MPDKYEIRAQYTPAILCSVPFILFSFYYLNTLNGDFWNSVGAQAAGGVTMAAALYYLAAFACRHTGKWLEDRIYARGNKFPTTEFLLDKDTSCSPERKQEIIRKINSDFSIDLSGRGEDTSSNRLRIHEAVGAIRQLFFKKNEMILLRNIQYGFAKNLAGGAIIALAASFATALFSVLAKAEAPFQISILLIVWYAMLATYGLLAMRSNSRRYAHTLYDEFLRN